MGGMLGESWVRADDVPEMSETERGRGTGRHGTLLILLALAQWASCTTRLLLSTRCWQVAQIVNTAGTSTHVPSSPTA